MPCCQNCIYKKNKFKSCEQDGWIESIFIALFGWQDGPFCDYGKKETIHPITGKKQIEFPHPQYSQSFRFITCEERNDRGQCQFFKQKNTNQKSHDTTIKDQFSWTDPYEKCDECKAAKKCLYIKKDEYCTECKYNPMKWEENQNESVKKCEYYAGPIHRGEASNS